eukprot:COSAG02_NODE_3778_length_6247_cov_21.794079_3_plen_318_part_00
MAQALNPLHYRCQVEDPIDGPSTEPGGRRWFCPHAATKNYEGGFDAASADVEAIVAAVHEDGFAVVRSGLPVSFVDDCAGAFAVRLEAHIARIGENDPKTRNRGPHRHYIDLPAVLPFAQIVSQPLVAAIVHGLLGPNAAAERLASDTPLGMGSVYQAVHLDVAKGGPFRAPGELEQQDVDGSLVLNWPTVDVTEANGPVEISRGSHRYPFALAHARIADGNAPLQRVLLNRGDFLLRDLRTLHRGSPNTTDTPRPNMTITFSPSEEVAAAKVNVARGIQRSVFDSLDPKAQWLWRAVKRIEGKPHAATGSNGYELY